MLGCGEDVHGSGWRAAARRLEEAGELGGVWDSMLEAQVFGWGDLAEEGLWVSGVRRGTRVGPEGQVLLL